MVKNLRDIEHHIGGAVFNKWGIQGKKRQLKIEKE